MLTGAFLYLPLVACPRQIASSTRSNSNYPIHHCQHFKLLPFKTRTKFNQSALDAYSYPRENNSFCTIYIHMIYKHLPLAIAAQ